MNSASTPVSVAPHARVRGRVGRTLRAPRAAQGARATLLAVVDGATPLKAAAVRVRRLLGHSVPDDDGTESPRATSEVLVGGPNMRFFHRSNCPMAADRDWSAAPAGEHSRSGRTPCGMCTP
jgi:hypothetical protein